MKNQRIELRVSINGGKAKKCDFRMYNGDLFWHGAPGKYAQEQYNGFIWPTNANIGHVATLGPVEIKMAVSSYLASFGVEAEAIELSDIGQVEDVVTRDSMVEKYITGEPTPNEGDNEGQPEDSHDDAPAPTPEPEPETPSHEDAPEDEATPTPEPTPHEPVAAAPQPVTPQPSTNDVANAFAALTPLFSGVQANVVADVMAQLQPVIAELQVAATTKARTIQVRQPNGETHEVSGKTCKGFQAMLQTLYEGEYLYLHGPAGCGKSYTAMQLAEAMGLKFYGMQSVLYEHQVTGFVDANGTYHSTPFSEAYMNGGVVLLDEFDASSEEAALTINNALANGVLAVQGLGNIQMHPDFHVIAAGNTGCTGADIQYTARRVLDASTVDRFMFEAMTYDEDIELDNANGDRSIVDFAHDVRRAMETAGIYHLFTYRTIRRLGNINLQQAYGSDADLLRSAFTKALGRDEVRLIYSNLQDTNNRWAKALSKLF